MYSLFFSFLLFSFLFSENVLFSVNGHSVYKYDFFQQMPYSEWVSLDSTKKVSSLDNFIEKELSYYDALALGLDVFPQNHIRLQERFRQLLVNNTYEHLVAYPRLSPSSVLLSTKHLSEEILVYHLLVGYDGCKLPASFTRNKEEAFEYTLNLKKDLSTLLFSAHKDSLLSVFSSFSTQFSEDPSVNTNHSLVGWISWGRVVASFQEAAFSLSPLTVSSPVLTPYGYHLIFIKEKRPSQYAYYNPLLFNNLSKKICLQSLSFDSLRLASARFDSSIVNSVSLIINHSFVDSLVLFINKKSGGGRLRGNKSSYVSWLSENLLKDVLFVFNNKGFGVGWFVNQLKHAPATRVSTIKSSDDFILILKTFVLQDSVYTLGVKRGVSAAPLFQLEFLNHKKNILKSEYVSFLINSLESADSSLVRKTYLNGVVLGNYMQPLRVVYSQVRATTEEDINRAYNLFLFSNDFDDVLKKFSGRVESPALFGSGGPLAARAFEMSVGEVSPPIENTNKSFSIIRVEEFLEETPFTLDHVYKQIERKLKKTSQDSVKENLLVSLKNKYNINSVVLP